MVVLDGVLPDVQHTTSPSWTHIPCDGTCADGFACNQIGGSCGPADPDASDTANKQDSMAPTVGTDDAARDAMDLFASLIDALHEKNANAGNMQAVRKAVSADIATVARHWRSMANVQKDNDVGEEKTDGAFRKSRMQLNQGARRKSFTTLPYAKLLACLCTTSTHVRDASAVFHAQLSTNTSLA